MRIEPLILPGTFKILLQPQVDERGYFMRTFDKIAFGACGLCSSWIQENQSHSRPNVLRGLHFQNPPHSEAKLIRAVSGEILDVFVDLRRSSTTYGRWQSIKLSAAEDVAVYIPKGFAHGFCTMDSEATVDYKIDAPYVPEAAAGLLWSDPDLAIAWPVKDPVVSARDRSWPRFASFRSPFD